MNALAWIVDALKTFPEPVSLPESLADAEPIQLAEARSRLQTIGQVANELRKLVDAELAGALQGSALNYGGQIMRPAGDRGSAKVKDEAGWWPLVTAGLKASPQPHALLAAMFPSSSVRLTALPKLAAALGLEADEIRAEYFSYDPPTSLLSVMPIGKAPKHLQDLAEGEIR